MPYAYWKNTKQLEMMMNRLNNVDGSDLGCVIDGSHIAAHELDFRIIRLAYENGYDVDYFQLQNDMDMYDELPYEEIADINEALWEESALAIDWMNSQLPEHYYLYVDDGSLYLTYEDEEGTEYNL